MSDQNLTLANVRRNCLDCSGGSRPAVIWCTCHGEDGTRCEFWRCRFGMQPATFRAKYGGRLLDPGSMPDASIELERLPGTLMEAATAEINVEGYHQPAVVVKQKPKQARTPQQQEAFQKAQRARTSE